MLKKIHDTKGLNRASEGEAVSGETAPAGGEQAQPRAAAGQDTSQRSAGTGWQGKYTRSPNEEHEKGNQKACNMHVHGKKKM